MWGMFADVIFKLLKTPDSFTKETKARLSPMVPIEGKTIHQYTGKEPQVIEIEILLHRSFCDPEDESRRIIQLIGSAQPLVIGDSLLGTYALEEIKEEIKTSAEGRPLSIKMTLKLKEV